MVGVIGSNPIPPTIHTERGEIYNCDGLFWRGFIRRHQTNLGFKLMKVRNSLKSLRARHRDNRVVRRKGRLYIINKTQKRFKARQG